MLMLLASTLRGLFTGWVHFLESWHAEVGRAMACLGVRCGVDSGWSPPGDRCVSGRQLVVPRGLVCLEDSGLWCPEDLRASGTTLLVIGPGASMSGLGVSACHHIKEVRMQG